MFVARAVNSVTYTPDFPETRKAYLKETLIEKKLIDSFFNALGISNYIPLNDEEKNRLIKWLKTPIELEFKDLKVNIPFHEIIFSLLSAISKLPIADKMRIKFAGSFVLAILGRSYLERLYLSQGVNLNDFLTAEDWQDLDRDFNKTLRDIDLRVYLPKANTENRKTIVLPTLITTLTALVTQHTDKNESYVKERVESYFNERKDKDNIQDGSTNYLRTQIGSKKLMLDISWIESLGREKLFERDDISFEVGLSLFEKPDLIPEVTPESVSKTIKPFIDILFRIITLFDPTTINKRGYAKQILEEIRGRKVIVEKDSITLFNCAFVNFIRRTNPQKNQKESSPKLVSFAEQFSNLIHFCHEEHTHGDFTSNFLLHLQGIANLYYFQDRTTLMYDYREEIESLKKEIIKIKEGLEEGVLTTLFSYLKDEEMTLSLLFDFLYFYQNSFGLKFQVHNALYQLDLKGRTPKDLKKAADYLIKKLQNKSLTLTELQLAQAVNTLYPHPKLKELILFGISPYLKTGDQPIRDVPSSVFSNIIIYNQTLLPEEALLKALFTHESSFEYGLTWLSRNPSLSYLTASCAIWALVTHPVRGMQVVRRLFSDLKPAERKQVVKLMLLNLLSTKLEARLNTPLPELNGYLKDSPDPGLNYEQYRTLIREFPPLSTGLMPSIIKDSFCKNDDFLSLVSGSTDVLIPLFKSLTRDSLKLLTENSKEWNVHTSAIVQAMYAVYQLDAISSFRIVFRLKANPNDLPAPIYDKCIHLIIEELSRIRKNGIPFKNALALDRVIEIARLISRKSEYIILLLELEVVKEEPHLSTIIGLLIADNPNAATLKAAWGWGMASIHKNAYLLIASRHAALSDDALAEMEKSNIETAQIADVTYSQIEQKNWKVAAEFIRRFHKVLPLDELIPILVSTWDQSAILSDEIECVFELFDMPVLAPYKKANAKTIYKKVVNSTSDRLEKRIFNDIKKNFTIDEIISSELIFFLCRSLIHFSLDEIKFEIIFISEVILKIKSFPKPVIDLLEVIIKRDFGSFPEGMAIMGHLSSHSRTLYLIETELFLESNVDAQFVIGMERKEHKRPLTRWIQRLYTIDPDKAFLAVKAVRDPIPLEQEEYFEIFSRNPNLLGFVTLIQEGFFKGLNRSTKRNGIFSAFLNGISTDLGVSLNASSLFRPYLKRDGYQYLKRWLHAAVVEKKYQLLDQLSVDSFNEEESVYLIESLFFYREDKRPSLAQEVTLLSPEARAKFYKRMVRKVRNHRRDLSLALFNTFLKGEGFIKSGNDLIELVSNISILNPDKFEECLCAYILERIKADLPNFKNYTVKCVSLFESGLEWYQTKKNPSTIIPYLEHVTDGNLSIPAKIQNCFDQILCQIMTKFIVEGVALHRSPEHSFFLIDIVANNLYLNAEKILQQSCYRTVFEQFLGPVVCDLKKYQEHLLNLKRIQESARGNDEIVSVSEDMLLPHIFLGGPLLAPSITKVYPTIKTIIEHLTTTYLNEKLFAPVAILHALTVIKTYDIETFKDSQELRTHLCLMIFEAIVKNPFVLKFPELCFSNVLNCLLPPHKGLNNHEHDLYSSFIQILRAKSYILFKSVDIDYIPEAFNLYLHLLENGYLRDDVNLLSVNSAIINSVIEICKEPKISNERFTEISGKLKQILLLDFKNAAYLKTLYAPLLKGLFTQCLESLKQRKEDYILSFVKSLETEFKAKYTI